MIKKTFASRCLELRKDLSGVSRHLAVDYPEKGPIYRGELVRVKRHIALSYLDRIDKAAKKEGIILPPPGSTPTLKKGEALSSDRRLTFWWANRRATLKAGK